MNLESCGFAFYKNFISSSWINLILAELSTIKTVNRAGLRSANHKLPTVQNYLTSTDFKATTANLLSSKHRLVRAIVFIKNKSTNWYVTWHQDRTVALSKVFSQPGWGPWSTKDGVIHAQAPKQLLQEMLTLRVHLTDTNSENGCLKLISGSHQHGILPEEKIKVWVGSNEPVVCEAHAGDAVAMRPLTLHSSSKSANPTQDRIVLHLEFSHWNCRRE